MRKLGRKLYFGIVEENVDPRRAGRIKVRVQSVYNEIPTEDIPWAHPFNSVSGKDFAPIRMTNCWVNLNSTWV